MLCRVELGGAELFRPDDLATGNQGDEGDEDKYRVLWCLDQVANEFFVVAFDEPMIMPR